MACATQESGKLVNVWCHWDHRKGVTALLHGAGGGGKTITDAFYSVDADGREHARLLPGRTQAWAELVLAVEWDKFDPPLAPRRPEFPRGDRAVVLFCEHDDADDLAAALARRSVWGYVLASMERDDAADEFDGKLTRLTLTFHDELATATGGTTQAEALLSAVLDDADADQWEALYRATFPATDPAAAVAGNDNDSTNPGDGKGA